MSDTATTEVVIRAPLDQDWRRVVGSGLIGALAMVFISLVGMPVGLDPRLVVDPYLSLGYLSLLWIPVVIGFSTTVEVVLEGVATTKKGGRDVLAGAVAGLISGAGISLLIVLLDNFNLRDPLVNWSPQLQALLTFDEGVGYGVVVWLLIGTGLGTVGAALHLLSARWRRAVTLAVFSVVMIALLEAAIRDLVEGFRLEFVTDWLYASRTGITRTGAVVVMVVVAGLSLSGRGRIKGLRQKYDDMEGLRKRRVSVMVWFSTAAAFVILPLLLGRIMNELLANVGLFVLLALGLNIVVGLAGLLDLGYVAFFAVGGYTTAVLTSPNSPGFSPEIHWGFAILITIVMAAIVGLMIGAPVIRMRGDYLAIVTLGFGEIIRLMFLSDWLSPYFGGAQGITNIPGVDLGVATVKGTDPRSVFYLVLFFTAIAVYVSWRLQTTRLGRAWMAIREDEKVAEAMGINTVTAKLMAFVVGAILASFSGAIFAAKVGSIFPSSFLILVSIIILVVVIVGGMGNITGVIVGAVVLIGILGGPKQPGLLQEFSEYKLLIYGALLVFMMLKRPEGLVPSAQRTRELHQDEFLQDQWFKTDDAEAEEATT